MFEKTTRPTRRTTLYGFSGGICNSSPRRPAGAPRGRPAGRLAAATTLALLSLCTAASARSDGCCDGAGSNLGGSALSTATTEEPVFEFTAQTMATNPYSSPGLYCLRAKVVVEWTAHCTGPIPELSSLRVTVGDDVLVDEPPDPLDVSKEGWTYTPPIWPNIHHRTGQEFQTGAVYLDPGQSVPIEIYATGTNPTVNCTVGDYSVRVYLHGGVAAVPVGDCASVYCSEMQNPRNASDIAISTCELAEGASIRLQNAPPGQLAYLLVSDADGLVVQPPGSEGDLCVSSSGYLGRYTKDVGYTDATGSFQTDISDSLSGGERFGLPFHDGYLRPGETWYFQYWHRQGSARPSTFSSALRVTFQ